MSLSHVWTGSLTDPLDLNSAQICFRNRFTMVALKLEPMAPIKLKGGTTDIYVLAVQVRMLANVGVGYRAYMGKVMPVEVANVCG